MSIFLKYKYLWLIFLVLLIVGGGLLYWSKYHTKDNTPIQNPSPKPSPKMSYPVPETYKAPILMYHYIRNAENESQLGKNLSVSPANFDNQLKWLNENNFQTLTLNDFTSPDKQVLAKIYADGKKPIVLTFDDGYLDAYTEALPILEKYHMTGTFFIIQNYIAKDNYMSQAQIDKMKEAGMEIGSHSLSHPDLTKIDVTDAQTQIADSKSSTTTFCYPSGKYDATTVKLVQEAGYVAAVTTKYGIADQNSSYLELPRVRVEDGSGETLYYKIDAANNP